MIYLSVISHGHYDIITSLNSLPALAQDDDIKVCIKDNLGDKRLKCYCHENGLDYITSAKPFGFGENNNHVYHFYKNKIQDNDFFVIFNPDVILDAAKLKKATNLMLDNCSELATINLYRDQSYTTPDNAIRNFPGLKDFFNSYFLGRNTTIIDKDKIHEPQHVDWAAGSLLIFKSSLYKKLQGFNTAYFMYCEDVDICWRAWILFNVKVLYIPSIKGIHHAQFNNRRFLSKHFFWHVKSALIFLSYKYRLRKINCSNTR